MVLTPKQAADDCMARARELLKHSSLAGMTPLLAADLRRVALVMGLASVDTYMHMVVLRQASQKRWTPSASLSNLKINFGDLATLANGVVIARSAGTKSRPWVAVKNALHRHLLRIPLQSAKAVGDAMAMGGLDKGWTKVSAHLGTKPEDVMSRLDRIHHRRNQIVHEGDLRRLVRPQKVDRNVCSEVDVQADLDWIDSLLDALAKELP